MDGYSPLLIARQNGHHTTVQFLLNSGVDVILCNKKRCIPLYGACFKEHASIVECLLKNGAEVDIGRRNGEGPLYIACENVHDIIVNYLFNKGANVYLCTNNGHSQLYAGCFTTQSNFYSRVCSSDICRCTQPACSVPSSEKK